MYNASMSAFAQSIMEQKYAHVKGDGTKESWAEIAQRVATHVMSAVNAPRSMVRDIEQIIAERKFMPGGRYLYATGRPFHQTQNCLLLRAEDSREGWSDLLHKASMALMTGAGIGAVYSDLRPRGSVITKTGGLASGPTALMQMVNEIGRHVRQGGSRRSAIWAGLHWNHADIMEFLRIKDWSADVRRLKEQDFDFPGTLDGTNVSVILDNDFFVAYDNPQHPLHSLAHEVYWTTVKRMLKTAEPGFSVDVGNNNSENLRNACTEITSADDSDICNLGSINLARINSLEEMHEVVELATAFLLAGTVYSHVPYEKVDVVRSKNRRLGLGLLGLHEWLLLRDKSYGPDSELESYLRVYSGSTDIAEIWANKWNLSVPLKTRAIAPTGTIGIVAETTTGIEPIFCAAMKRRYWANDDMHYQYVLDPTAKRLVDMGIPPEDIEDAYTLAEDVERRVDFQRWVQKYVDHAISSTINLPQWGTTHNNEDSAESFGTMLLSHLPGMRGVTCYPDGARGGQPLTRVDFRDAASKVGQVFIEQQDVCDITKAGSCGV